MVTWSSRYGVMVVGAPGSGKTTLCRGLGQLLTALQVKHTIVNLDPASEGDQEGLFGVDCRTICRVRDVMEERDADGNLLFGGPNGALMESMERVLNKMDTLLKQAIPPRTQIDEMPKEKEQDASVLPFLQCGHWVIFDLPGQSELFTVHEALQDFIKRLCKAPPALLHSKTRLPPLIDTMVTVNLVEAGGFQDRHRYMSTLLLSLQTMLHLGCPAINVMSKIDTVQEWLVPLRMVCVAEALPFFGLDQIDVMHSYQKNRPSHPALLDDAKKQGDRLIASLAHILDEYGLLSFIPLAVEDKQCMLFLWHRMRLVSGAVHPENKKHSFKSIILFDFVLFNAIAVGV